MSLIRKLLFFNSEPATEIKEEVATIEDFVPEFSHEQFAEEMNEMRCDMFNDPLATLDLINEATDYLILHNKNFNSMDNKTCCFFIENVEALFRLNNDLAIAFSTEESLDQLNQIRTINAKILDYLHVKMKYAISNMITQFKEKKESDCNEITNQTGVLVKINNAAKKLYNLGEYKVKFKDIDEIIFNFTIEVTQFELDQAKKGHSSFLRKRESI